MNPEKRSLLPVAAFASFASRFQRPEQSEGFQDVIEAPFVVRSDSPVAILIPALLTSRSSPAQTLSVRSGPSTGYKTNSNAFCKPGLRCTYAHQYAEYEHVTRA